MDMVGYKCNLASSAIKNVACNEAVVIGAPFSDVTQIYVVLVLGSKIANFKQLSDHLSSLNAHNVLFLLKNCFSMLKLLYTSRKRTLLKVAGEQHFAA